MKVLHRKCDGCAHRLVTRYFRVTLWEVGRLVRLCRGCALILPGTKERLPKREALRLLAIEKILES